MSYVCAHFHCVFSTKERRPFITPELGDRLWPFLGGIARQNGMNAVEIGGMPDHVHLLLSLPSTIAISKAMQLIKGGSSKWMHETFSNQRTFSWQEEYGAGSFFSWLEVVGTQGQKILLDKPPVFCCIRVG